MKLILKKLLQKDDPLVGRIPHKYHNVVNRFVKYHRMLHKYDNVVKRFGDYHIIKYHNDLENVSADES